jgi:hypothetical protein
MIMERLPSEGSMVMARVFPIPWLIQNSLGSVMLLELVYVFAEFIQLVLPHKTL